MMPTDLVRRPDKGFAISAEGFRRDQLVFQRHHTGAAPIPSQPLRPLWPVLVGGLFLLIVGANLILTGAHAVMALGGAIIVAAGLGLLGWFGFNLGRQVDEKADQWKI